MTNELTAAERTEFRGSVRDFLEKKSPEQAVRRTMETTVGFDPELWREMNHQLGLQAIAIPEEFGGAGLSFVELGVVFEEMGRALLCAPFLSSVALAGNALLLSRDEDACGEFLGAIANGSRIATVAISENFDVRDAGGIRMRAARRGGQWVLNGAKTLVLDGVAADLVFVFVDSDAGISLLAVDGPHPGLTRIPLTTLDPTRKFARLEFGDVPARLVGEAGQAGALISPLLDIARAALAMEAVGGAQRCLDMAVEHAKTRVQFGNVIGSFQAIQHRCADLMVEVELAKSAAYLATNDAAHSSDALAISAPLAKAFCADAYCRAAEDNIQIHGGMGFTWDHPAHLYYRRARSIQLMMGDGAYHREQLAQRLGL